jgi:hypothetical protein
MTPRAYYVERSTVAGEGCVKYEAGEISCGEFASSLALCVVAVLGVSGRIDGDRGFLNADRWRRGIDRAA